MTTTVDLDWDAWRESYDTMTFAEQRDFYEQVATLYPYQQHFTLTHICQAFEYAQPRVVAELGGWNGRLAAEMLSRFDLASWINYDIVDVAQATTDSRYRQCVLTDYLWNLEPVQADIFVATHTIEHLKLDDLRLLVYGLDCEHVFFEAPLQSEPTDWRGYAGSHVLEVGWDGVDDLMADAGYHNVMHGLWERGSEL